MTTGFCALQGPGPPDQLWQGVAGFTDDVVGLFSDLARRYGMHVLGSHLTEEGGKHYNVGYLCTPRGDVHRYRKVHLFPIEVELGEPPRRVAGRRDHLLPVLHLQRAGLLCGLN